MRTSTAMLSHAALASVQTGAFAASAPTLPWWGTVLIQIGLLFGQGVLASINSNTDQNGNPLPPAK